MNDLFSDSPQVPAPWRHRPRLRWAIALAGALLVLGIATLLAVLKYREIRVFAKMTPEQRAGFDEWYTKKLTLPPEALEVKPFAPETMQAVEDFFRLCDELADRVRPIYDDWMRIGRGFYGDLTGESYQKFLTQHREAIGELQPLLAAFRHVVASHDYTVEAWRSARNLEKATSYEDAIGFRGKDAVTQFKVAQLCYMDALACLQEDRNPEAIADADALVAFAQMDPYASFIGKMMGILNLKSGLRAYQTIADRVTDPEQKKAILASLEARRGKIRFESEPPMPLLTLDAISGAQFDRRLGIETDLQNKTGYEIYMEALWAQVECEKKFGLAAAPTDAKTRKQIERDIRSVEDAHEKMRFWTPQPAGLKGYFGGWVEQINAASLYSVTESSSVGQKAKVAAALKQYDDLLASLASPVSVTAVNVPPGPVTTSQTSATVTFANGARAELVAVGKIPDDGGEWWAACGQRLSAEPAIFRDTFLGQYRKDMLSRPDQTARYFDVVITDWPSGDMNLVADFADPAHQIRSRDSVRLDDGRVVLRLGAAIPASATHTTVRIGLVAKDWATLATGAADTSVTVTREGSPARVTFGKLTTRNKGAFITVRFPTLSGNPDIRLIATNTAGQQYSAGTFNGTGHGADRMLEETYLVRDVPDGTVFREFALQTLDYDRREISDVPLEPSAVPELDK